MAEAAITSGRVGFVGLGNMGMPMARHLVAAGYDVTGFDASPAVMHVIADAAADSPAADSPGAGGPGAGGPAPPGGRPPAPPDTTGRIAAAPALTAVGERAAAVVLMLPDSGVVEQVLLADGLLASLTPRTMVIDMSSSDPARTRELAARAAERGVTLIDAPVSGGVAGAVSRKLTIMVGGSEQAFTAALPLLSAIGSRVVRAGDVGAGHAVKALNNLMSAAHLIVSSEALIAGRRFGLDPAVMLDIINGSSGRSGSTENKWPNYVLTERYDAGFSIQLMVKDMRLALGIAHATGTPATVSEAALAAWEAAAAHLPSTADHTQIARWLDGREP